MSCSASPSPVLFSLLHLAFSASLTLLLKPSNKTARLQPPASVARSPLPKAMQMCKNQSSSAVAVPRATLQGQKAAQMPQRGFICSTAEAQLALFANPCPGKEALAASCSNSSSKGGGCPDEPCLITVPLIPSSHPHSSVSTSVNIPASGCPAGRGTHLAARSLCSLSAALQLPLHAANLLSIAWLGG